MMGFVEEPNTACVSLAKIVKLLLASFKLTEKVIAYLGDEGLDIGTLEIDSHEQCGCSILT
jgi:hypothetical protein